MSRSGMSDDADFDGSYYLYRGTVDRSIAGKRGQAFLRELRDALDAMPVKELVEDDVAVADDDGKPAEFCTLGVIAHARGLDTLRIDPHDVPGFAKQLGISECMAREIVYENDDECSGATDAQRWKYMREWVERHIKPEVTDPPKGA